MQEKKLKCCLLKLSIGRKPQIFLSLYYINKLILQEADILKIPRFRRYITKKALIYFILLQIMCAASNVSWNKNLGFFCEKKLFSH